MTSSPLAPNVFRGALVTVSPIRPGAIIFQYNPETAAHEYQPRAVGDDAPAGLPRLAGPPEETIKLTIEFDATDVQPGLDVDVLGVAPALAALELLLYPPSAVAIANEALTLAGVVEILPMETPLTLLVWGPARILPVRVTSLSITEELFDAALVPIRAKVDLGLAVVSYHDVGMIGVPGALSLAAHIAKEVLATANAATGAATALARRAGGGA